MEYAIGLVLLCSWLIFTKLWFALLLPLWCEGAYLIYKKKKKFPIIGTLLSLVVVLFAGYSLAITVN